MFPLPEHVLFIKSCAINNCRLCNTEIERAEQAALHKEKIKTSHMLSYPLFWLKL